VSTDSPSLRRIPTERITCHIDEQLGAVVTRPSRPQDMRRGIGWNLAPVILMDSSEPFPFTDTAVTILRPGGVSPSSGHVLNGPGSLVIEYALWADKEIGHAYELEHIWVFVDDKGRVLETHGSAHGSHDVLNCSDTGKRPVVYSEPGKHGMAGGHDEYCLPRTLINTLCGSAAGTMGIYAPMVDGCLGSTVSEFRQAWNMLRRFRFAPVWDAGLRLDVRSLNWWHWPELDGQRAQRALASVSRMPIDPVRVSVGPWGGTDDAWIGEVFTGDTGVLYLGPTPAAESFKWAQRRSRLIVAVTRSADEAAAISTIAWDSYASAHTLIACPEEMPVQRPVSMATRYRDGLSNGFVVVTDKPNDHYLTLGPGGDLDCPAGLLLANGWTSSRGGHF